MKSASRAMGALFSSDGVAVVYYVGHSHIKWTERSERQFFIYCQRVNFKRFADTGKNDISVRRAVVFYGLESVAAKIIQERRRGWLSPDSGYTETYLLPYTEEGRDVLSLMAEGSFKERFAAAVLPGSQMGPGRNGPACDARRDGVYYFFFAAPDITRLARFMSAARHERRPDRYAVICFDFQKELAAAATDGSVTVYSAALEDVKKKLRGGSAKSDAESP